MKPTKITVNSEGIGRSVNPYLTHVYGGAQLNQAWVLFEQTVQSFPAFTHDNKPAQAGEYQAELVETHKTDFTENKTFPYRFYRIIEPEQEANTQGPKVQQQGEGESLEEALSIHDTRYYNSLNRQEQNIYRNGAYFGANWQKHQSPIQQRTGEVGAEEEAEKYFKSQKLPGSPFDGFIAGYNCATLKTAALMELLKEVNRHFSIKRHIDQSEHELINKINEALNSIK